MLVLQVRFRHAEEAKQYLKKHSLFEEGYGIGKDADHLYFPVKKKAELPFPHSFVNKTLQKKQAALSLTDKLLLDRTLTPQEVEKHFVSSFDIAGDIAVLEIMPELVKKEKRIAKALLELYPHVKTVAKKTTATIGKYRVREVKVIAGKKRLKTRYKENGCAFDIDLSNIFFSSRLSFERLRVAELAKPGENVLTLFAGAGFFPIVLVKKQPFAKRVVAIELNPDAVKQMKANVFLNRMEKKIEVLEGDVNRVLKKKRFHRFADRVIMPLPHSAFEFLDATLLATRKGGVVHFYFIPPKQMDAFKEAHRLVHEACNRNYRDYRIDFQRVVKTYAPHVDHVVLDVKLLN